MQRHIRNPQMQAEARAEEKHKHFSETKNVVVVEKSLAAFVCSEVILEGMKRHLRNIQLSNHPTVYTRLRQSVDFYWQIKVIICNKLFFYSLFKTIIRIPFFSLTGNDT